MLDKVQIRIVNNLIKSIPTYATKGSAGLDLRAAVKDKFILDLMKHYLFQQVYQYSLKIKTTQRLSSSLGLGHKNGIVLGNLVGLIDSDYQGSL